MVLIFSLKKDPILSALLVIVHMLSVLVIWFLPLFWWACLLLSCLLMGSCWYFICFYAVKKHEKSILQFRYDTQKQQAACYVDHEWRSVSIHYRSVVMSWLMCLDCIDSQTKARYKVLIWAKMQSSEQYRRLVKILKLNRVSK